MRHTVVRAAFRPLAAPLLLARPPAHSHPGSARPSCVQTPSGFFYVHGKNPRPSHSADDIQPSHLWYTAHPRKPHARESLGRPGASDVRPRWRQCDGCATL